MYASKKYYGKRTHSRVPVYTVTRHSDFDNFLMNPDYIHEDQVRFVYKNSFGGQEEKIIPITEILQHAKSFPIFKENSFTLKSEYKGWVYKIDSEFIINY